MVPSFTAPPHVSRSRRGLSFLALALVLSAAGCTIGRNPVSGNRRLLAWSWEEEQRIGAQADEQIVAQYGLYSDEQVQQYVERVGERVLANSDLRDPGTPEKFRETEFTFRVLASPVVNAFALPGGYVYVTRGLLAHLNNEAQLAVVLGHEITHVAARHASQQAAKQQLARLGLLGGAIFGQQVLGLPGGTILNLGSTASQLLFLEYSRDNETESDVQGVEYAAKAGYEVEEAAAFFNSLERLQTQHGPGLPTWLSTHPDPGGREQHILELAAEWEQKTQTTLVDQDQYYSVIDDIILGENPRLGFVEGGVFYHPELRFKFPVPRGFQVQNTKSQVAMVDPEGRAQLVFTDVPGATAQEAAAQMLRQLRAARGVEILDQGRATASEYPAYYLLAGARTQQGELRALYYFIEYGGDVWVFQGLTTAAAYPAYEDVFLRTMRGFDRLTDRGILSIEPVRTEIVTAGRTAPFRAIAERYVEPGELPPGMDDLGDLALLNQVQLDTVIEAGTELKMPRR